MRGLLGALGERATVRRVGSRPSRARRSVQATTAIPAALARRAMLSKVRFPFAPRNQPLNSVSCTGSPGGRTRGARLGGNQIWLEIVQPALELLAWMPMLAPSGTRRPPDATAGPSAFPPSARNSETAHRKNRRTVMQDRG